MSFRYSNGVTEMKTKVLIPLLLLAAANHASAQLYKHVGSDGRAVYSDRPVEAASGRVTVIKAAVLPNARGDATGNAGHAQGGFAAFSNAGTEGKLQRVDVETGPASGSALVQAGIRSAGGAGKVALQVAPR